MQTFTKVVFGWYLGDCASLICLISPVYNHTKLVHRWDNLNNKALIYITYISCNHKLSRTLTCKLKRGLKWGCHPLADWMCRLRVEEISSTEWWSRPSSEEIQVAELSLRVVKITLAESSSQLLLSEGNPTGRVVTSVGTWSGVQSINRLDASTLSGETPSNRVVIRLWADREKFPRSLSTPGSHEGSP